MWPDGIVAGALRHCSFNRVVLTRASLSVNWFSHQVSFGGSRSLSSTNDKPMISASPLQFMSDIDAEPLYRYTRGGYHPVHLGDQVNHGRYRIVHKLGWGGYSTVWAAKDQHLQRYVALKICTSDRHMADKERQLQVMRAIALSSLEHEGTSRVIKMLDHFDLDGPNGTHECLVLELLGPSVPAVVGMRFPDNRLPAQLAKPVARQVLSGLDYLHQQGIGHGDLHTGNVAFTLPALDVTNDVELYRLLGKPEVGKVRRASGEPLEPGVPEHMVRPSSFPYVRSSLPDSVKMVDFGESFFNVAPPETLHTPLPVRAPEVLLKDKIDRRVDLWGMGCLLFELYTGQPPFDVTLLTPGISMRQMEELATDELPDCWLAKSKRLKESLDQYDLGGGSVETTQDQALQQWLEEVYLDDNKNAELNREDLHRLGELVKKMLYFEPSSRATKAELLQDDWLR